MNKRKPYHKPELKKIALVAEEALLGMCKAASGTSKQAGKCRSIAACTSRNIGS
jgi:hypothetical protein